jgi:hypothetical protein
LHFGERLLRLGKEPPSISERLRVPVTFKSRDQLAAARDPELRVEDQLFADLTWIRHSKQNAACTEGSCGLAHI